jgi:flagellar biosynthesis chaperone FliJ
VQITLEKVLAQILSELKDINTRLDSLETRQAAMEHQLVAFQQFTLERFDRLEGKVDRLEVRVDRLEGKVDKLGVQQTKTNLIVENEIRPAIQALAEGQVLMQAQLDRIESKVTTHDEFIFKRIK